jgi:parvulin-like peptidyl-prolyl isomerase
MRTTALNVPLVVFATGAFVFSGLMLAAEKTPLASLANLATALTESDADGALDIFDSKMQTYPEIEQKLEALTAQDDINCSIDIVTDEESEGLHKLDLDWFMQLKSQIDDSQLERRRVRVQVEMRQIKGAWKIVSLSPVSVLDPLQIH